MTREDAQNADPAEPTHQEDTATKDTGPGEPEASSSGRAQRREEFYIHPEILLGRAGYRRVPSPGGAG